MTISATSNYLGTVRRKRQIAENGEYVTDVSKTYPRKEAKMERPDFLVDIGASKTVSGKEAINKMLSYFVVHNFPQLHSSFRRFRFANESFKTFGWISIYLGSRNGVESIPVEVDIVIADFLSLLGLEFWTRNI